MSEFNKEFFQRSWGEDGYFEEFSYGVGIDAVCERCVYPYASLEKNALEIGSGGGSFTKRLIDKFNTLTAIDVIRKPKSLSWDNLKYIELNDSNRFSCPLDRDSIDFGFSYGLFCHLSNTQIKQYLTSINKVLKEGSFFIFMLSNFKHTSKISGDEHELGTLLNMGHYVQDLRTIELVVDFNEWEIINNNMIPDHRDIIVHIKKI